MTINLIDDKAFQLGADAYFVPTFERFGEELKLLRRQWAVTNRQPEVCFDKVELEGEEHPWASLSKGTVRALEDGERSPQLATLVSLLQIYGVLSPELIAILFEKLVEDLNDHVFYVNKVVAVPGMTRTRMVSEYPRRRGGVIRGPDGTSDLM